MSDGEKEKCSNLFNQFILRNLLNLFNITIAKSVSCTGDVLHLFNSANRVLIWQAVTALNCFNPIVLMMFLSLPRSNVVSGEWQISVWCVTCHVSSLIIITQKTTCRKQSALPGEEVIIGNSTEALGRQDRVSRSDYDAVIMPNYVHIYLFSGASQPASTSAKM